MMLWHLTELEQVLGLPASGRMLPVQGFRADSRTVQPGEVFLALRSARADGHDYLQQAAQRGAVAAIVTRPVAVDLPQLLVPDVPAALRRIAQAAVARHTGQRLAITGSVGKTTVRDFLTALLAAYVMPGNLNGQFGLPFALAHLPPSAAHAVLEIGIDAPNTMAPLAQLAQPQVAGITGIFNAHIENFATHTDLQREKLRITTGLPATGVLVLPVGQALHGLWPGAVFRHGVGGDMWLEDGAVLCTPQWRIPLRVQEATPARLACALVACAMAQAAGVDVPSVVSRLHSVPVARGRGQVLVVQGVTVIDDAYNASLASMAAALTALKQRPALRRFALLGQMNELGADTVPDHTALAAECAGLDGVWLVGEAMAHTQAHLPPGMVLGAFPTPTALEMQPIAQHLQPGDAVLVKGSNSIFYARKSVAQLCTALQAQVAA